MGNKLAFVLIATAFAALILLNPGQEEHRRTFMDYAHAHFFELPAGYRAIYEQFRDESLRYKESKHLRYGNFILFSTLSHNAIKRLPNDTFRPGRRLLSFGVLGLVWPVIIEPSAPDRPAIDQ